MLLKKYNYIVHLRSTTIVHRRNLFHTVHWINILSLIFVMFLSPLPLIHTMVLGVLNLNPCFNLLLDVKGFRISGTIPNLLDFFVLQLLHLFRISIGSCAEKKKTQQKHSRFDTFLLREVCLYTSSEILSETDTQIPLIAGQFNVPKLYVQESLYKMTAFFSQIEILLYEKKRLLL